MESGIKQDLNLDINTSAATNEAVTCIFFSLKTSLQVSVNKKKNPKNRRTPTYGRVSACLWGGTRRAASCPRPACRLSATANCSYSSEPRAGWRRWRPGARPPCPESGADGCSWIPRPAALPPRWRRGPAAPPCCPSCWAPSRPHQHLQEGRCCQRHGKTPGTGTRIMHLPHCASGKRNQECSNNYFGFAFHVGVLLLIPLFLPHSWGFCFSSPFSPAPPTGLQFNTTHYEGRAEGGDVYFIHDLDKSIYLS